MTPQSEIAELRRLLAKASMRPWRVDTRKDCVRGIFDDEKLHVTGDGEDDPHDLTLIAAAINALPRLLDTAESGGKGEASENEVERIARIIDPESWRVMDGYLAETKRKYANENASYDPDAFKHKDSMKLAREIITTVAAQPSPWRLGREEVARIIAPEPWGCLDEGRPGFGQLTKHAYNIWRMARNITTRAVPDIEAIQHQAAQMLGLDNWDCSDAEAWAAVSNGSPLPSCALTDIAAERSRQVYTEGWTAEHDDEHINGEMSRAAACYAAPHAISYTDQFGRPLDAGGSQRPFTDSERKRSWSHVPALRWPWALSWWKPKDRRANLVRAGALIVAEIERLDRLDGNTEWAERCTKEHGAGIHAADAAWFRQAATALSEAAARIEGMERRQKELVAAGLPPEAEGLLRAKDKWQTRAEAAEKELADIRALDLRAFDKWQREKAQMEARTQAAESRAAVLGEALKGVDLNALREAHRLLLLLDQNGRCVSREDAKASATNLSVAIRTIRAASALAMESVDRGSEEA